jgi:phosphatidylglycerophosphate synthase
LGAGAVLFGFVMLHRVEIFKWVLLGSLLSDIADGLIARAFHLTTKLGAFLDSVADVVTMFVAVLGVFASQRTEFRTSMYSTEFGGFRHKKGAPEGRPFMLRTI